MNEGFTLTELYCSCIKTINYCYYHIDFIEEKGEELLVKFLNTEFGGWPILDDENVKRNYSEPIDILIKSRMYGLRLLVNVYVTFNPKDPKYSVLKVNN